MGFLKNLFGRKDKLLDEYVPDAGIHYYRPRYHKAGDVSSNEITIISYGDARVHIADTDEGTMLVFNEVKDDGEYCLSIIVPDSVSQAHEKIDRSGGTFTVRGHLRETDLLDGNGVPYCPIVGTLEIGTGTVNIDQEFDIKSEEKRTIGKFIPMRGETEAQREEYFELSSRLDQAFDAALDRLISKNSEWTSADSNEIADLVRAHCDAMQFERALDLCAALNKRDSHIAKMLRPDVLDERQRYRNRERA